MNDRLKRIVVIIVAILSALLAVLFIDSKKTQTKDVENIEEHNVEIQEISVTTKGEKLQDVQADAKVEQPKLTTQVKKKSVIKLSEKQAPVKANTINKPQENVKENIVEPVIQTATGNSGVVEVTREYKIKGGDKIRFQGVNYIIKHKTAEN